ncbi:hypothetical protein NBRC111894_3267 [Sporolactobacillus inulinus]|uniref:Uncharacterized protein n=1 Tax=Sporolactobacillus inulinus TaxID=2078 RepID=A0A4Y1ZFD7_9BACL|nr:hypothetical protein NBRC111894_3267 [Sporolactobacillus inulinus]
MEIKDGRFCPVFSYYTILADIWARLLRSAGLTINALSLNIKTEIHEEDEF